jgi:hypothetical protein
MYGNAILLAQSYVPSNNSARVEFWAAVGAVFGAFLFFRGFSMLRIKRLILNTPSSKIRSASMGLVEITGMATGPHTIPAGITGEPCFYYRAMAWQLRQSGRSNQWRKVADESLYVPFFVEDSTGRMLVNPQGAELDVHRNFKDEIGESLFANRDTMPEISPCTCCAMVWQAPMPHGSRNTASSPITRSSFSERSAQTTRVVSGNQLCGTVPESRSSPG